MALYPVLENGSDDSRRRQNWKDGLVRRLHTDQLASRPRKVHASPVESLYPLVDRLSSNVECDPASRVFDYLGLPCEIVSIPATMRTAAIRTTKGTLKYRINFFVFSSPRIFNQKPDLLPLINSSGFLNAITDTGKSNSPTTIIQCACVIMLCSGYHLRLSSKDILPSMSIPCTFALFLHAPRIP